MPWTAARARAAPGVCRLHQVVGSIVLARLDSVRPPNGIGTSHMRERAGSKKGRHVRRGSRVRLPTTIHTAEAPQKAHQTAAAPRTENVCQLQTWMVAAAARRDA